MCCYLCSGANNCCLSAGWLRRSEPAASEDDGHVGRVYFKGFIAHRDVALGKCLCRWGYVQVWRRQWTLNGGGLVHGVDGDVGIFQQDASSIEYAVASL